MVVKSAERIVPGGRVTTKPRPPDGRPRCLARHPREAAMQQIPRRQLRGGLRTPPQEHASRTGFGRWVGWVFTMPAGTTPTRACLLLYLIGEGILERRAGTPAGTCLRKRGAHPASGCGVGLGAINRGLDRCPDVEGRNSWIDDTALLPASADARGARLRSHAAVVHRLRHQARLTA